MRLFHSESHQVPPVSAIAVGADADNTAGRSLAYVGDIQLRDIRSAPCLGTTGGLSVVRFQAWLLARQRNVGAATVHHIHR